MRNLPIYDRHGRCIGFLIEGNRFIDLKGKSIAWLNSSGIYDYTGQHRGWWQNNYGMASDGGAMFWAPGASPGLVLPIPSIPPIPPIASIQPIKPIPNIPPIRPIPRLNWSLSSIF
ncbi:4-fold beta flower protein [Asticcacaulis sp.]|uniref:4-fold beta flower protein n=1 Tax=Asticcacaulis sp. TaxID=1872648 RepID=UPI0039C85DA2